jgi:hypothetical protein
MYICPHCSRTGFRDDGRECICRGWGVLNTLKLNVPVFQKEKPTVAHYEPFFAASKIIPTSHIRDAITSYRIGYNPQSHHLATLGIVEKLIELGEQFDTQQNGEWLRRVLLDYDSLIIAPDGIWIVKQNEGCCILQFPAETL